jgi:hypothetical protein
MSAASPVGSINDDGKCVANVSGVGVGGVASCEMGELPMWLVAIYLVGNTALSLLNFYWFSQMLKAVRKRFVASPEGPSVGNTKKSQ